MRPPTIRQFFPAAARLALVGSLVAAMAAVLPGCKTLETATTVGAQLGAASGFISQAQADAIAKSGQAVARSFEDFTPEQEYYIGRTIGAVILGTYPAYDSARANRYVNELGQTLAAVSDMPETFGGYHFLIQDADDINALSAPGGLIFITRGLIRCCENEDALAAVLAHEIGHVQHKHGLQAIQKSRVTTALTTIGVEGAKAFAGEELASLTRTFEGSIQDISQTLINSGYSRSFEQEADRAAVVIMGRLGYNPNGLVEMLSVMQSRLKPGGVDFARTHPTPEKRIQDIRPMIPGAGPVTPYPQRQERFQRALAGI